MDKCRAQARWSVVNRTALDEAGRFSTATKQQAQQVRSRAAGATDDLKQGAGDFTCARKATDDSSCSPLLEFGQFGELPNHGCGRLGVKHEAAQLPTQSLQKLPAVCTLALAPHHHEHPLPSLLEFSLPQEISAPDDHAPLSSPNSSHLQPTIHCVINRRSREVVIKCGKTPPNLHFEP